MASNARGDSNTLTLTAGELDAAFADDGFVAVWEFFDKFVGVRHLADALDLFEISLRIREADIFEDRAVKQEIVLQNDTEMFAVIAEFHLLQIISVDLDDPSQEFRVPSSRFRVGSGLRF